MLVPDPHVVSTFGPFRFLKQERLLFDGDRPVRLGARATDLLLALLDRPGEQVSKTDLMRAAWPSTTVTEGNLPVNMNALRRALGDGEGGARYIVCDPGRGYRFIAPVGSSVLSAAPPPRDRRADAHHNLPANLTALVGRETVAAAIEARFSDERMITIVGPAGAGKTVLAVEVARSLAGAYADGVWLAELAPVDDERGLAEAVAAAIGAPLVSDDARGTLIANLRDRRMLLVFDNCEQVIEPAAALAIDVLRAAAGVNILATSREPLRIEGEGVCRLAPLESPPESPPPSAADVVGFPATRLFVERATAAMSDFQLREEDAPFVADVCRMLDGLPLAIEFAAARIDTLGLRGLASRLDDRLRVLGRRRSSVSRHSTIAAALDWSHDLLTPAEQTVFRRLAIFAGGFTLDAATTVVRGAGPLRGDVTDHVLNLVGKSLVAIDRLAGEPRLRLFETTRAYAFEKLAKAGEVQATARRHAEYYQDVRRSASEPVGGNA